MLRDAQDRLLWGGLVCTVLFLGVLLVGHFRQPATPAAANDKTLERELVYQARVSLLHTIYAPVARLRQEGQPQAALLKLEELARRYPGEAHGFILKGEILRDMGVLEEAVASLVSGVRRNGDYIDANSPLSRREEIRRLVAEGMESVGARARANPGNASAAAALKALYYLQSRLAGGCE